jgi:hypothetical protein
VRTVAITLAAAACGGGSPVDASSVVRLDGATFPPKDCDGEPWQEDGPDMSVELTSNGDGWSVTVEADRIDVQLSLIEAEDR